MSRRQRRPPLAAVIIATLALPVLTFAVATQASARATVPSLSGRTTQRLAAVGLAVLPADPPGPVLPLRLPWAPPSVRTRMTEAGALDRTDIPGHRRLLEAELGYLVQGPTDFGLVWVFVGSNSGAQPLVWMVRDSDEDAFRPLSE